MEFTSSFNLFTKARFPTFGKFSCLSNIQIPALAEQHEILNLFFKKQVPSLQSHPGKIGHEEQCRIDDAEHLTFCVLTRQLEHGGDQRRSIVIADHISQMFDAEILCRLHNSIFFAEQDDFNTGKQSPGFDRVALDYCNMRIGKRLGSGEKSDERHKNSLKVRVERLNVLTFQCPLIDIFQRLRLNACFDFNQFSFIMNEIKHFLPRKIVAAIESRIHLSHELQIFRSIYCPAIISEVNGVIQ